MHGQNHIKYLPRQRNLPREWARCSDAAATTAITKTTNKNNNNNNNTTANSTNTLAFIVRTCFLCRTLVANQK